MHYGVRYELPNSQHQCKHNELLRVAHHGPWAKFHMPPTFINKVSLKHSHAHVCLYCLPCCSITGAEPSHRSRDPVASKDESVCYLALYRKSLSNPWVAALQDLKDFFKVIGSTFLFFSFKSYWFLFKYLPILIWYFCFKIYVYISILMD